jgi:hypothetical protein
MQITKQELAIPATGVKTGVRWLALDRKWRSCGGTTGTGVQSEPTARFELATSGLRNSPEPLRTVPRRASAAGTVWVFDGLGRGGTARNARIGLFLVYGGVLE